MNCSINTIQLKKSTSGVRATGVARRTNQIAFSLVEVLVAIVILTVGIVAFLQIFPPGFLGLQVASNTANADRIAAATLQELLDSKSSNTEEIAAITQMYTDSAAFPADAGMVNLDPAFNIDSALAGSQTPPLKIATPPAATPAQEAGIATGFNITNSSTAAPFTPTEQYQYIKGENVTIPQPSGAAARETATIHNYQNYADSNGNSNAILNFGPVLIPQIDTKPYSTAGKYPGPTDLTDPPALDGGFYESLNPAETPAFFVHGTPWTRVLGSSLPLSGVVGSTSIANSDPEDVLTQDAPQYLIDYANQEIAFRVPSFSGGAAYKQTFQMKYQYINASNQVVTAYTWFRACWPIGTDTNVNDVDCYTETDSQGNNYYKSHWVAINQLPGIKGTPQANDPIIPNSEVIVRDFQLLPPQTPFSNTFDNDPYEVTLSTTTNLGQDNSGNDIYLGELTFNPLAAKLVGVHGSALHATVDYIASDWHTIHEDRTVGAQSNVAFGANNTSTSRLTFNHLLQYTASDHSTDQIGNSFYGIGQSLLAHPNLDQSVLVVDLDTFEILSSSGNSPDYTVDYTNGSVTFPTYPAGAHVRIFYRPADDWGTTVVKPAATYSVISSTLNTLGATPDSPSMLGQVVDGDPAYPTVIFFPSCDSGSQVLVNGTATYSIGGVPQPAVTVSQLLTVEPAAGVPIGSKTIALSGGGSASVNTNIPVNITALPTNATNVTWSSLDIKGGSLTVRVIWREQNLWHHRDITTVDIPTAPAT